MILPDNGKVVVFDDKHEDIKDLLSALSKKKIPYLYYQDEAGDDLPDTPIENIRLVFLDLELVISNASSHNIISSIAFRLRAVLEKNPIYVLIYWSTKENKYREALEQAFSEGLKDYKPIMLLSLNKAEAKASGNQTNYIIEHLQEEIKAFSTLNAFITWETIVNNSAGSITNQVLSFYPYDVNTWDSTNKFLLHKLAKAYSGSLGERFDDFTRLKNAMYTLNHSLIDNIETGINMIDSGDAFNNLLSRTELGIEYFNSKLNKTLLVSNLFDDVAQPGNVYFIINETEDLLKQNEEELEKALAQVKELKPELQEQARIGKIKKHKGSEEILRQRLNKEKTRINSLINSCLNLLLLNGKDEVRSQIFDSSIGIDLNITPICDYAQEKTSLFRVLPGLLVEQRFKEFINKEPVYCYISDPIIHILDKDYFLVFDFRYLSSFDESEVKLRKPKFRLKHQFLSDIQVKMSSHISRSGIFFVG
ncbi:hypothetical protein GU926_12650 [Nibribacter ruber]|uniref:Response receiver domain-containing protein n=1 Tax=Nibribacter ruber TaxID=2698458 RepID=A0A6P1P073_9BACT|nr:hypothetical protein [Nibribacter ruber]QHL88234.1 hypothetical protein GU926_12650 [Nibribacter ruber]